MQIEQQQKQPKIAWGKQYFSRQHVSPALLNVLTEWKPCLESGQPQDKRLSLI